jgi:predicted secreted Zn-dependent protease
MSNSLSSSLVLAAALLASFPVHSEVTEALRYTHYPVRSGPGLSLAQSINAASPIREHGRVFHGRTDWNIHWNYKWSPTPHGGCRITQVSTRVEATIKLPQLDSATPAQRERFASYLEALRRHELGHFDIARQAANSIDKQIAALPESGNCRALESAANAGGERTLNEYRQREVEYDASTQHGKTQGAWLDR